MKQMWSEDDYSIDKAFGGWLKERRVRKAFSLEYSSFSSEIPIRRLKELEDGVASEKISEDEIQKLSKVYGLDPRAMRMRSVTG